MSVARALNLLSKLSVKGELHGLSVKPLPGLPHAEIARLLIAEGLTPTEPLLTWFAARNGVPDGTSYSHIDLPAGWMSMSIEQAIEERRVCIDVYDEDSWPVRFFPIARRGSGGILALDSTALGDDAPAWGGNKMGFVGEPAPSLEAVVRYWIELIDSRALTVSRQGWDAVPADVRWGAV